MMNVQTTNRLWNDSCAGITDGNALLDLAQGWLHQGNVVVALELLKSAMNTTEASRDHRLRARILKETGRARMMESSWETAEALYLEAQQIFMEIDDKKGASECARNRANMAFQKGLYRKAEQLCETALEWSTEINDHELRATILNTLGAIQSATDEREESIKTFRLCLTDFESCGNIIRQGYVLLNIGLTETELKRYPEAIVSLNSALAIALEEKDLNLVEICYQNISKCYLYQNEIILAKSVIDTARKLLPGLNSKALECELNLIDGRILRGMGDLAGAEEVLEETYQMTVEHQLSALMADVLYEQGVIAKDHGNVDLAYFKFDTAAKQYSKLDIESGRQKAELAANNALRGMNA